MKLYTVKETMGLTRNNRLKNKVSVIQFYISVALLNFTIWGEVRIKNILNNHAQLYFLFGVKNFNLLYIF